MDNPAKEKGRSFHTATLENKHLQHSNTNHKSQLKIDKSALMSPSSVLDLLGVRYHRSGDGLSVYCPFHKNGEERNASLLMNPKDGHFKCFACSEKGGDVIAFFRAVTGAGFVEALKALGGRHGR